MNPADSFEYMVQHGITYHRLCLQCEAEGENASGPDFFYKPIWIPVAVEVVDVPQLVAVPAVPEPSTLALVLVGVALVAAFANRPQHRHCEHQRAR